MSGPTTNSQHCVFCTEVEGSVLLLQAVYLQKKHVLVVVSGDGESALHRI